MDSQQILRILSGKATKEEKTNFYSHLEHDPEAEREYLSLKELWIVSGLNSNPTSEQYKAESFKKFWEKTQSRPVAKIRRFPREIFRYAAMLVVALATGFFLNYLIPRSGTVPFIKEFRSGHAHRHREPQEILFLPAQYRPCFNSGAAPHAPPPVPAPVPAPAA